MAFHTLTVALIHDVFDGDEGADRLGRRLSEARERGARLALLPELPMDRWIPAGPTPGDLDAETAGGPRHVALSQAARAAAIGVLGGAITVDDAGRRRNRALLFDASGKLVLQYDKVHVPNEEGFWEAAHYEEGDRLAARCDAFGLPVGVQICSDLFRPEGCHLLGAAGVEAIFAPRATPLASYARWKSVISVNAVTSGAYVVSINRPGPDSGIGGASVVAGPDGTCLLESTDPVSIVTLDGEQTAGARKQYPGYLSVHHALYARGWDERSS
jgi:predicted amidohydrolase